MPQQRRRSWDYKPDRHLLRARGLGDDHREQQLSRDHRGWRHRLECDRQRKWRCLDHGRPDAPDMAFGRAFDPMNVRLQPMPDAASQYSRLGPIGPLMANPRVTEIMVMGVHDVYIEVDGKVLLTPINFSTEDELMDVIRYIVESVGRRVDVESPLSDARLADGSRVHVAEARDMLQSMNTGHDGSMTSLHANKPRDALSRIVTLVLMARYELPLRAIRALISSAIDVIVHLRRMRDGSRKVFQVSEVT